MPKRAEPKPKKTEWVDDGRVIAAMDPDTMSGNVGRRKSRQRLDASGQPLPKPEPVKLTRSEKGAISRGVLAAYVLLFVAVVAVFALFLLFCTKVWFR